MNKLDELFNNPSTMLGVKKSKRFFMAHMIAGYPSLRTSEKIAQTLIKGGTDIIELQIPLSDPMADGPTIAVASEDALKNGASVTKSLALLKKISKGGKPIAVMSYMNPIFRFGIRNFVRTIKRNGASALIVPDCPFDSEEGKALLAACNEENICLIPVVSPGVPQERLVQLAKEAKGFVYCTSRQGITGANSRFAQDLFNFIEELKKVFDLPIAVGFGVKSRKDVMVLARHADITIAGSFFVSAIKKCANGKDLKRFEKIIAQLIGTSV